MEKDSKVVLLNRKILIISGIEKVLTVSESSISLLLNGSTMNVFGENMEVKKLDVEQGLLEVEGRINNIKYLGVKEKIGFFKRIFK